jgi:hypothetical protein
MCAKKKVEINNLSDNIRFIDNVVVAVVVEHNVVEHQLASSLNTRENKK